MHSISSWELWWFWSEINFYQQFQELGHSWQTICLIFTQILSWKLNRFTTEEMTVSIKIIRKAAGKWIMDFSLLVLFLNRSSSLVWMDHTVNKSWIDYPTNKSHSSKGNQSKLVEIDILQINAINPWANFRIPLNISTISWLLCYRGHYS